MTQEAHIHVFADVEQMTAVRTTQYEEKPTRIRTEKNKETSRKQGTKTCIGNQDVGSN